MAKKYSRKEALQLTTLFKTIFESMIEGIIVYDLQDKILHINIAAQKLLEVRSGEVIGTFYYQLINHFAVSEEHRQLFFAEQRPTRRILQDEAMTQMQHRDIPIQVTSGREIQVNITNIPVYSQKEQVIGGFTMFQDITEQHETAQRTLNAFTCLLTLVEALAALPEPSIDTRCNVSPIIATGKALATVTAQVLDSQYVDVFSLDPPDDRQCLLGVSGLNLEQEQRLREETSQAPLADYIDAAAIMRLHANHVVTMDLKQQSYTTPHSNFGARYRLLAPMVLHKKLIGLLVIAKTDTKYIDVQSAYTQEEVALAKGVAKLTALVIERVHLLQEWAEAHANEIALQETNSRYDAFLSIASHELRTPLTTVKGNIQLAQRRLDKLQRQDRCEQTLSDGLERIQKPLEEAVQRANTQERIISEMLDVSRIRANKLTLIMQSCDLGMLVRDTVKDVRHVATGRTILLHLPGKEILPIIADADRIRQVVSNYLSNALKYSSPETTVEIYVKREGSVARVEVCDKGPGLSQEAQAHVWELFYRAPGIEVQYGSDTGLGLGLYLCRTIVEHHHGQIGVKSLQGVGSTFWFTLPIMRPNNDQSTPY